MSMAKKTTDKINFRDNIRNFAGIRANSDQRDFVIGESPYCKSFINLACIKSPGLSSAPSIALETVDILKELGLGMKEKKSPVTTRRKTVVKHLSHEDMAKVIEKNPLYGRVICRCETITEGEIVDALKSPLCPSSIDGVKRRAGTGMGRCQGGFCGPRVASIIARERHIPLEQVLQDREDSEILVEETKKGGVI
jgi:glycerol-3-phosphate dehydrogenase